MTPPYRNVQEATPIRALKRYFHAIHNLSVRVKPDGGDFYKVITNGGTYRYEVVPIPQEVISDA